MSEVGIRVGKGVVRQRISNCETDNVSKNFLLSAEENPIEKAVMAANFSVLYVVVWPEKTVIKPRLTVGGGGRGECDSSN